MNDSLLIAASMSIEDISEFLKENEELRKLRNIWRDKAHFLRETLDKEVELTKDHITKLTTYEYCEDDPIALNVFNALTSLLPKSNLDK